MGVETDKLTSSKTILEAVQTALEAVTISGSTAFAKVELFDLTEWEAALKRLYLADEAVALVTWSGEDYEVNREEVIATTKRRATIDILFSDFNIADSLIALIGDDAQPGSLGLLDAVLPAITGVLIDATGNLDPVVALPVNTDRMIITEDDQNESPGRNVLSLTLAITGPYMQVGVGASNA